MASAPWDLRGGRLRCERCRNEFSLLVTASTVAQHCITDLLHACGRTELSRFLASYSCRSCCHAGFQYSLGLGTPVKRESGCEAEVVCKRSCYVHPCSNLPSVPDFRKPTQGRRISRAEQSVGELKSSFGSTLLSVPARLGSALACQCSLQTAIAYDHPGRTQPCLR